MAFWSRNKKSEVTTQESSAHFQAITVDEREIIDEARDRLDIGLDGARSILDNYQDDVRFLHGVGQWSDEAKAARGDERPMLTINKLPAFVDRAIGDHRKNKIGIVVSATGAAGNEEMTTRANKQLSRAQATEGLVRDIEQQSSAQAAYDTALETVLAGGIGYWVLTTEYVDDDVFEQRIGIQRILDPTTVIPDPFTKESDRSDMNWCFVLDWLNRKEFDRQYPGAFPPGDLSSEALTRWANWLDYKADRVRVAEYFRRVPEKKRIVLLSNGKVMDATAQKDIMDEIARGAAVTNEREVRSHRVEWFRIGGTTILEGPVKFPSRWIPVVTVVGKELCVDGEVFVRGIVRHSKDACRAYNYWRTAQTEGAALQPRQPYIAAWEQVEDYLDEWKNANTNNAAVLLYSHIPGLNPPQRQAPAQMSPAYALETQNADADIKATLGRFESNIGNADASKQSGVAIERLEQATETSSYVYIDNLGRALKHSGRIMIDMIPRVYDTQRVVRLLGEDGAEDFVQLYQEIIDEQTGQAQVVNDLRGGRMGVSVQVGPSYTSQRARAVAGMLAYLNIDREAAPLIRDLVVANLDFPTAKLASERLRRTVAPELLEGERGDEGEQRPPSMADRVAAVEAEAKLAKAEADVAKAEAAQLREEVKLFEDMTAAGLNREALTQLISTTVQQIIKDRESDPNNPPPLDQPPPGVVPE